MNETPIQWASRNEGYGFTHLVALLLEKGASIDHKSTLGLDALYLAVQAANANIAFMLMAIGGADANTIDNSGTTPLLWLYKRKKFVGQSDIELIRLLLSFGADPALIDTFYDKNTTSGTVTSQGNNCLHYMALAPSAFVDFAMLQNLVEKGGNDMLEACNGDNKTPLDLAVEIENEAIIRSTEIGDSISHFLIRASLS